MTRKLWDRLSRKRPLSMPRDAEMCPSRSFDATPSHVQQSVLFFHDKPRPPSCESPARNCRRELISFSEQELVGEARAVTAGTHDAQPEAPSRVRRAADWRRLCRIC
ncbi:hypothetical protein HU200_043981 [Digitaria exilis]|uniref:Uncharacterized protein n=1 Tax=Digitaria exilis TaxID=1010633 RepID=A0A835B825_9POAL|nr:hypothetical protein HU200_043981 [Digitaria exilis]